MSDPRLTLLLRAIQNSHLRARRVQHAERNRRAKWVEELKQVEAEETDGGAGTKG